MTRLAGWARLARLVCAPVLGAALSRALAPWHDLWIAPLALAGFSLLLLTTSSPRLRVWQGWLFGLGYFAFSMSWIVEPFQVDPDRHGWMAPFALLFLSGGLALFWGAAIWGANRLAQPGARYVAALVVTWSLAEFARAYLLTGLPWAAFGQFWVDSSPSQLLPWIGPQGLAVLTLVAGLGTGLALAPKASVPQRAMALVPLFLGVLFWALAPAPPETEFTGKTIRLVQPNAPQHQKWDPDYMGLFFQRQLDFTAAPPQGARPDLVVWPETAIPVLLEDADFVLNRIAEQAGGAPVALGLLRSEGDVSFNSLAMIDGQGRRTGVYDKHHLVPFGEYIPLAALFDRLGVTGLAQRMAGGFSAGPGAQLLEIEGIGQTLPLICYEAVFPQDVNAATERPNLLMQITNDAWFGAYSGPYQHLAQARMRAIEQGAPLLRAANTGITAMIDPYGRVLDSLPLGEAGFIDAPLPKPAAETLYRRTGDWPVLLVLLIGLVVLHLTQGRDADRRNLMIKD